MGREKCFPHQQQYTTNRFDVFLSLKELHFSPALMKGGRRDDGFGGSNSS